MRLQLYAVAVLSLLGSTACGYMGEVNMPDPPPGHGPMRQVTVYEIVGTQGNLGLSTTQVETPQSSDPATDAVRGLLGHRPTERGHDSLWAGMCRPADAVRSVQVTKTLMTVRLRNLGHTGTDRALCDLTWEGQRMQRQQVVWTVRAATGSRAPVRVIVGAHSAWMPPTTANPNALGAG